MCHGQTLEIRTANGARLKHDGGRLVRFMRPETRTIGVLFRACDVQKPILSLGCLAKQRYESDVRADTGTQFVQTTVRFRH